MIDPFATLGLARRFDVDLAVAEANHRELSRALHPDRHASAAPTERRAALAKAIEVNEAWRVVRDPIRRAEALLEALGAATGERHAPPADADFLMDMLEQREALAEARRGRDAAAVRALAAAVEARSRGAERALAQGFDRGEAVEGLSAKLGELKFYRRFLEEVSAIEDELAA